MRSTQIPKSSSTNPVRRYNDRSHTASTRMVCGRGRRFPESATLTAVASDTESAKFDVSKVGGRSHTRTTATQQFTTCDREADTTGRSPTPCKLNQRFVKKNIIFQTGSARISMHEHTRGQKARDTRPVSTTMERTSPARSFCPGF